MRQDSINDLLIDAKENFALIENYKKLPKVKVANIIGNLRCCLDYCSKDISTLLPKPKKENHFPYSDSMQTIDEKIEFRLPGLKNARIDIYDEIVRLHHFHLSNRWLKILCDLNNMTKHDDAISVHSDTSVSTTRISINGHNFMDLGGSGIVTGNTFNGVGIGNYQIQDDQIKIIKKSNLPLEFKINKKRQIIVGDEKVDLIPFLRFAIVSIEDFINSIYSKINIKLNSK